MRIRHKPLKAWTTFLGVQCLQFKILIIGGIPVSVHLPVLTDSFNSTYSEVYHHKSMCKIQEILSVLVFTRLYTCIYVHDPQGNERQGCT